MLAVVHTLLPAVVFAVAVAGLSTVPDGAQRVVALTVGEVAVPLATHVIGAQMVVLVSCGVGRGPLLAAGFDGIWIRAQRWPTRLVYLSWPDVVRIRHQRWLFDHIICVYTDVSPAVGPNLVNRLDTRIQRVLFGTELTAVTFYSGRRPGQVLAQLRRLSAGRIDIG